MKLMTRSVASLAVWENDLSRISDCTSLNGKPSRSTHGSKDLDLLITHATPKIQTFQELSVRCRRLSCKEK